MSSKKLILDSKKLILDNLIKQLSDLEKNMNERVDRINKLRENLIKVMEQTPLFNKIVERLLLNEPKKNLEDKLSKAEYKNTDTNIEDKDSRMDVKYIIENRDTIKKEMIKHINLLNLTQFRGAKEGEIAVMDYFAEKLSTLYSGVDDEKEKEEIEIIYNNDAKWRLNNIKKDNEEFRGIDINKFDNNKDIFLSMLRPYGDHAYEDISFRWGSDFLSEELLFDTKATEKTTKTLTLIQKTQLKELFTLDINFPNKDDLRNELIRLAVIGKNQKKKSSRQVLLDEYKKQKLEKLKGMRDMDKIREIFDDTGEIEKPEKSIKVGAGTLITFNSAVININRPIFYITLVWKLDEGKEVDKINEYKIAKIDGKKFFHLKEKEVRHKGIVVIDDIKIISNREILWNKSKANYQIKGDQFLSTILNKDENLIITDDAEKLINDKIISYMFYDAKRLNGKGLLTKLFSDLAEITKITNK